MNSIYASRRRRDIIVRLLCVAAALFGVTWLALILFTLFYNGVAGISVQLFTQNTPPPGSSEGGLLNAIVGSVIMTAIRSEEHTSELQSHSDLVCRLLLE